MKKLIFILSISLLIFWEVPSLAADLSAYNYIQDMKSISSEDEIKIIIKFGKPIKKIKKPQFFEKSIQFSFNKTYIIPAKKTLKTEETIIPDLNIYQYDKNNVRLRLIIGEKDARFQDRLKYEIIGNKLVIKVLKNKIDLVDSGYDEKLSLLDLNFDEHSSKPIGLFSEKKEVEKFESFKFNETDESKENLEIGNDDNDLAPDIAVPTLFSLSLKTVSALLIVLSLMLMVVYFVKKYLLKEGSLLGMDKKIKVLSTSYIAPKKSINIVEIAGEILVLGLTANSITFLTKIENKEAIDKIKRDRERPLISKPSFSSFAFNFKKTKKGKDKNIKSAFSKQLDIYSDRETRGTGKNNNSIKALNSLIQEKIKKLKTA